MISINDSNNNRQINSDIKILEIILKMIKTTTTLLTHNKTTNVNKKLNKNKFLM